MSVTGTPQYRAPEILNMQPYDAKVDIWSAGLVLYYMKFKEFPFDEENLAKLVKKIKEFDLAAHFHHNSRILKNA